MLWARLAREPGEGVDGSKPLIPRGDRATSSLFQMRQKTRNNTGREVVDYQFVDRCFEPGGDKRQKQTEGIAIALLRISRHPAFMHQMI